MEKVNKKWKWIVIAVVGAAILAWGYWQFFSAEAQANRWYQRGLQQLEEENFAEAETCFNRAEEKDGAWYEQQCGLARALYGQEEIEKAQNILVSLTQQHPTKTEAYVILSDEFAGEGRWDQAEEVLRECYQLTGSREIGEALAQMEVTVESLRNALPSYAGQDAVAVIEQIKALGLVPETTYQPSAQLEEGKVINTQPAAGMQVQKGGTVLLLISTGTGNAGQNQTQHTNPDLLQWIGASAEEIEQQFGHLTFESYLNGGAYYRADTSDSFFIFSDVAVPENLSARHACTYLTASRTQLLPSLSGDLTAQQIGQQLGCTAEWTTDNGEGAAAIVFTLDGYRYTIYCGEDGVSSPEDTVLVGRA